MLEQGIVTRVLPEDRVEITLQASEACERCGACHRQEDGKVGIEAVGTAGLTCGDVVEIEISTGGVVAASFVVYLLPVLFLIAGAVFGSLLANVSPGGVSGETAGIVGAFVFLAVGFSVVRWYDGKVRRKGTLRARVTRVLSRG